MRPTPNECRDWFRGLPPGDRATAARFCELTADAIVSKIGLKLLSKLSPAHWLATWEMIEAWCLFWHDEPPERFRELKALKAALEQTVDTPLTNG